MSHSNVIVFFKANSISSLVEYTWTLEEVVVGKRCPKDQFKPAFLAFEKMTYKTFLSATWCFHKYQVHTLEVPNAFLHPKRWDRVTLTKEYTHNEHHCLKQLLLQTYIQVRKLGRKVGLCIDKVASKGPIVVTKSDATRRDHNLLLFKLNSQFHTIRIPLLPFTNQKPHHRGNRQDWIASKNTYPLTSPKWEYPQATFKQHWCAQLIDLKFVFVFVFGDVNSTTIKRWRH